jgi:glycosyl transferase family 2
MPGPGTQILMSIIVPAYNAAGELGECLDAISAQSGPDTELIVVDDASTDQTAAVAAKCTERVLRLSKNSGPAAARNFGASRAQGRVLVFVDADVVIASGALDRIRRSFAERPDISAIFGSYDATPRAPGYVSRYRNLLHHFTHQTGRADAATFWAGCGAVRGEAFRAVGGFDAQRFPRPSIEDIDLGRRLREAGYKIILDRLLQGTHLKCWRLLAMLRTDITQRAIPWSKLIVQTGVIPDALSLVWAQRLSATLVAAAVVGLAAAWLKPSLAVVAIAALATVIAVNRDLYRLFYHNGGLPLAIIGISLHLLYFVYSSLTYTLVWLAHRRAVQLVRGLRAPTLTQQR